MMKSTLRLLLFIVGSALALSTTAQTYDQYRSVRVSVTADASNGTLTLDWDTTGHATQYNIYRRELGSTQWGNALANLSTVDSQYIDSTVLKGQVYEYSVQKITDTNDPYLGGSNKIRGYAYAAAAIERPALHFRGKMLLVVTEAVNNALATQIDTLTHDMVGDGWDVYKLIATPSMEVSDIKSAIMAHYQNTGCDAIYLLGNVPVPYSGLWCGSGSTPYPPDGHGSSDANSHCGAWVADVHYGTVDGGWTDFSTINLAKRPENNHTPGDGKFDNTRIPSDVKIAVGRVDMSRLPAFADNEIELTRKYLAKTHRFKMAETSFVRKAVFENNFGQYAEAFASAAVRDFSLHVGGENVIKADVFSTMTNDLYQFSYAAGAGWYTSCSGFGTTNDFNTKNPALFSYIFGSFFGDYDISNNIMRASLAAKDGGLVCAWNGRPKWITHTLAIGESFRDVTIRTQNNYGDYDAMLVQNAPHIALLGDVSLRTEMLKPSSISNITALNNNKEVLVQWNASTEPGDIGYYVYRSHRPDRGFKLINEAKLRSTEIIDHQPFEGTNYYMVRASKLTTTASGSYYNLSIGQLSSIENISGKVTATREVENNLYKVYPTLASDVIYIEGPSTEPKEYSLRDLTGKTLKSGNLIGKRSTINIQELATGTYYFEVGGYHFKFIKE